VTEREADGVAPRLVVAGVVDLVEDHESLGAEPGELGGGVAGGDLLVGGDEAVHVAGEAVAGAPVGVELQAEAVRGERPLDLEVAGRCDDDQRAWFLGEAGRAQARAKVVLPAPGVATARKSGEAAVRNCS
jgi:hypothetical protein